MATLAFSIAGQFAGGLIGGPIGATIGRALGALAGSAVDNALFGDEAQPASSGRDIRLQSSSEGMVIPRIFGWNRVGGNIIWATELQRITGQSSGAKGTNNQSEPQKDVIVANFAVAFCEGEVTHLGRVWADGELLDLNGVNVRFYKGDQTQLADSLIAAKQGAANTPTYRGTCYMVFERLPLEQFGNRIPNISAELCRASGDLENQVRAVTVIPGATEFGYDPIPRVRIVSPGKVESENTHMLGQASDWSLSIDELTGMCPNLEHVALVVAWFGNDLRCGSCAVQPRVEGADREIKGTSWQVSGLGRADVPVVTQHDGGPAYGGTPSDNAVLAAIADLKARGIAVTLYPILLMDIATDNVLTDPYTQLAGQSSYPWRGRITCDPAPGVAGTPDKSAAIDAPVSAFIGGAAPGEFAASGETITYSGPVDWGYRRMILHYAHLAQWAGGVDAMLIGSELRGLTGLRRSDDEFPFVEALVDLAADVRAIVGGGTKITYAADWTEYSGFQPSDAPGDKLFHLDPLWASADIDAVGIDNYMPLSDWRDGSGHADADIASSIYDLDYLQGNIVGGEGFDWYYASPEDRDAQVRTPITDGAYGEPWVWRNKDLAAWWGNAHYNRISGVREASATVWVPQSKPIWFAELGCGAVDKGSNLPSAFADAKSAEDARPYFSAATPDTMIQRQFLRAHHQWWRDDAPGFVEAQNPQSGVFAGRMIDTDRLYLWTWDARPYPAFPNLTSVWADAENYATGHWLNGRLGAIGAAEILQAAAADFGTTITAAYSGGVKIDGFQIENMAALRGAIEPLLEVADLNILDRPQGLVAVRADTEASIQIAQVECVIADGTIVQRKHPDPSTALAQLGLNYLDRQRGYMAGTATAIALNGEGGTAFNSGLVIEPIAARRAVEQALGRMTKIEDVLEFSLPPSQLALEVGDVFELEGQIDGPFVITELRDGLARRVVAKAIGNNAAFALNGSATDHVVGAAPATGAPYCVAAHIPVQSDGFGSSALVIGAVAIPWPAEVSVEDSVTGGQIARLTQSATIGGLVAPLTAAEGELWDRASVLDVQIYDGHLASATAEAVLAGSNRAIVERDDGTWEIIGFADAELVSGTIYRLSNLLRGLDGTLDPAGTSAIGRRFMLLDAKLVRQDVREELLGGNFDLTAYAGAADSEGTGFVAAVSSDPLLPLAPAHVAATRGLGSSDIEFVWVRRARRNGNSWGLADVPLDITPEAYRVQIFDGSTLVRTLESASPSVTYLAADQTSDFGGPPTNFNFTIAQVSPSFGAGHTASGVFDG